ncbi:hypoxanthine-guanine phosphoribosyltransferase [Thiocystis violacea]|uniref:hypoxanthine-guanine phosphoribosyltransferase n=1 Tax=Thiocystis violacea TaxID=13725 RepID=UPI001904D429|nr:hypoxanthine-guanine phosphoribosyltransferase [Thiocystis violacea]MBK1722664.1 hypoxanthine-guanine phosphoribosyltransferase [Thiocystis violacea]
MKLDSTTYSAVAARAECLVTHEDMEVALDRMALELTRRLAGKDPLVLCVMTGAAIVTGLLLPRLDFQLRLDYIHATRYRGATKGGEITWRHRPSEAIRGEHVLVLDDILDEGVTVDQVIRACHEDGAASVHSAVLVEKQRPHQCEVDVVGVRVPDRYLYGYGLDYKNYFRNVRGIYAVADEDV